VVYFFIYGRPFYGGCLYFGVVVIMRKRKWRGGFKVDLILVVPGFLFLDLFVFYVLGVHGESILLRHAPLFISFWLAALILPSMRAYSGDTDDG